MERTSIARVSAVALGAALLLSSAGCSVLVSSNAGNSSDQQIMESCKDGPRQASDIEVDQSGSSSSEAIRTQRLAIIEDVARRTALCGNGHLLVRVFSSSSGATQTLFDGDLILKGATDNAKLRRVDGVVDDIMTTIATNYAAAVAALPSSGSDITSVYRLGSEYIAQLGADYRLSLYVLTDGLNNVGLDLTTRALSADEATELASSVNVPALPDASISVIGLGRVDGDPAPSNLVEGLVAFYGALCKKSGAVSCTAVTDYSAHG